MVPDGIITTVAGPGSSGNSGEFGPATSAYLSIPRDVEAVPDGGFLIADSGVHEIRRVLPDGDHRDHRGHRLHGHGLRRRR